MRIYHPLVSCASVIVIAVCLGCGTFLPENHPPVIDKFDVNGQLISTSSSLPKDAQGLPIIMVAKGSTVLLDCHAHDPDVDPLTYTWSGGATGATTTPSNYATFAAQNNGNYIITCTVQDNRDGVTSQSVDIQVFTPSANQPPTASISPAIFNVSPGGTQALVCNATDPDGDKLTYTWSAVNGKVVQNSSDPTQATYTAPTTTGTDTIYCVVTDGNGNYVPAIATATVK